MRYRFDLGQWWTVLAANKQEQQRQIWYLFLRNEQEAILSQKSCALASEHGLVDCQTTENVCFALIARVNLIGSVGQCVNQCLWE
jgi:hypothetical protein